jgi:tetratricopeptide (TPR) repeat protein
MRTGLAFVATCVLAALNAAAPQCPPAIEKLAIDQKYDSARVEVGRLLKTNPADDAALACMGETYEREGKSGDAVDWYEKAVKANERDPQHHLSLAQALGTEAQKANKLRQPFLARRLKSELERAVALDPNLIDAHEGLRQYYTEAPGIVGGSIDRAKEQAEIIAKLNPLRGHLARASIARHQGDLALAENEYKAAVAQAPDSLFAAYTLGAFYENQKRWADAAAIYDRLIGQRPAELLPHFFYGRVAAVSGDNVERGEREMRYWIANAPADAPLPTRSAAHSRLGAILEHQGKRDAARAEYETALSINPKNADAKKRLDALR